MNSCTVFALTISLLLALSYAAPNNTSIRSNLAPEPRIVGGDFAQVGQFPYQVYVQSFKNGVIMMCGGALLSSRYVLTTAQCLQGITNVMVVAAGVVDISDGNRIIREVLNTYPHPNYSSVSGDNDIAVLELAQEFRIDDTRISVIPVRNAEVEADTSCTVSGWGSTTYGEDSSNLLQYTAVPVVSRETCTSLLSLAITNNQICAGYIAGGSDACQGDGPLVCDGLLTGFLSLGNGCGLSNRPKVYTKVYSYIPWLQSIMGLNLLVENPNSAHRLISIDHLVLLLAGLSTLLYYH